MHNEGERVKDEGREIRARREITARRMQLA
jgi:hypothetical protein